MPMAADGAARAAEATTLMRLADEFAPRFFAQELSIAVTVTERERERERERDARRQERVSVAVSNLHRTESVSSRSKLI